MAKGDKSSAAGFLPIEEVASTLRVTPSQVLEWVNKSTLRGNDAGIKPYDLKKFQLDHLEDIRKAQAKALKDGQKSVDKKPAKSGGFFSRIFGGGKSKSDGDSGSLGAHDTNLAQENRRLRDELNRARSGGRDDTANVQLEDKIKYLEDKLAKTGGLEAEIADLRRQLASSAGAGPDPEMERQLDATRRELSKTLEIARQSDSLQSALRAAESERDRLVGELSRQASLGQAGTELSEQLEEARLALHQAEDRLQSQHSEEEAQRSRFQSSLADREARISALERELETAQNHPPAPAEQATGASRLNDELLVLQEVNLARFARLRDLYQQAQAKLAEAPVAGVSLSEASIVKLQSEFETLRVKHQSLLEARETNVSGHQEFIEQLAAARATTTRLKQENTSLKSRLSEADLEGWKAQVDELQGRLAQGNRASDASLELVETELRTVRKSLQNREAQVQKIAGRLQENERALKKALKESTRLTELLIERENRLRDLSTEYEQEYRDKIDTLDRQVSGLQWKLSLREERIASLESEVSELRKSKS